MRSSIRIVRLDGDKMKKRIRESPKVCLKKLTEFIPKFQYEKLDVLCETLKIEHEKVSRKSQSIDMFVVVQRDLKELSERFDKIATAFQEIE